MVIEKLQKFGLSDKEAKVYKALFELGGSIVTHIAKKTGINRSTAYVLLETLVTRGLVSISERRGVRFYNPVSSDRLIEIAEGGLKKSKELLTLSHELARDLKISAVESSKPQIKVYEGAEGFKIVSEDKLSAKGTIRSYTSVDYMSKSFPKYFPEYQKRLVSKKHHVRALFPDTQGTREWLGENIIANGEKYLIPDEGFTAELNVYDNKVTFVSPAENTSVIIESTQLAKAIKTLFDLAVAKARRWNVQKEEKHVVAPQKDLALVKAQKRFFSGN